MSHGPVVLTGGTGLVGGALLPQLRALGAPIRALVRRPGSLRNVEETVWDGVHAPTGTLAGAEALIHLAGEPVFGGLPTAARRERLRTSRVDSTRALVGALAELPEAERPRTFLCASAVGYYGDRGDDALVESTAPGDGLLADLCVDWEAAAAEAERLGVRTCSFRIGVVLSRRGGALALMARPFRLGLGGRLGNGRQWFPWVHLDDLTAMLREALSDDRWRGPVNAVAPNPVRNVDLTRAIGRAVGRPAFIPVPALAVRAALGPLADELLGSKRVEPRAALGWGFEFRMPELAQALAAELG
ncbi:MAG: TIGR01777 family oxidoreductase [Deltaproteobacteria bacterium]|nr:TIGR01777 family oxidoreductase [Deltaproteobacteria bacterium]